MNALDPPAVAHPGAVPRLRAGLRLQWEPAQQCRVLLFPEGMVRLNGSAGEILAGCDGVRDLATLTAELQARFGREDLAAEVTAFVDLALHKRWLELA